MTTKPPTQKQLVRGLRQISELAQPETDGHDPWELLDRIAAKATELRAALSVPVPTELPPPPTRQEWAAAMRTIALDYLHGVRDAGDPLNEPDLTALSTALTQAIHRLAHEHRPVNPFTNAKDK